MRVADILGRIIGEDAPIRIVAYDGSKAGPDRSDVALRIESPAALARLVSAPGTLGLARAYVTGEMDVEGDLYTALDALADVALQGIPRAEQVRLVRELAPVWLRHRRPPPPIEARPRGRLHSKFRDRQVISHHYDVSNRFYEWVLGPSMTYTCACYPDADASASRLLLWRSPSATRRQRGGASCGGGAIGRRCSSPIDRMTWAIVRGGGSLNTSSSASAFSSSYGSPGCTPWMSMSPAMYARARPRSPRPVAR